MVRLNDQQREELKKLVETKSGYKLPGDMKIDPAGNLNEKGGWAGLPTAAKLAIIAGATVATAGAAGAFSGPTAASSAIGSGSTTLGSMAVPELTTAAIPGLFGSGATAGTGGLMSTLAGAINNPAFRSIASGAGRVIGQMGQASAQNRGAETEAQLAHDQLSLAAQRERRSAETDTYRKSLFGQLAAGYQPSQRPPGAEGRNSEGFITPEAREAGRLLYDQAMNRMRTQDYPSITPFSQLPTRPRLMEQISNYAGPALSLFDPRLYGK